MTSPRPYGGPYSSPSFADTPIYDSLVAERGTPQIAPIRVPSAYEPLGGYQHSSPSQPALPALPALPSGPSAQPAAPTGQTYSGYQGMPGPQQPGAYAQQQQAAAARQYPGPHAQHAAQPPGPQQMRPAAPRPAAPRPMPTGYQQQQQPAPQRPQYPGAGYWSEQGGGH